MKNLKYCLRCTAFFFLLVFNPARAQFEYSHYDQLLQQIVVGKHVDYGALLAQREVLDSFIVKLERISPDTDTLLFPGRADQLAYWINAYNAFILKKIIDNYPVNSIKDIKLFGFLIWLDKNTIGNKRISFKALEDGIIRERFRDPRIHFAINCASISCPPLMGFAYIPDRLDKQLDSSTVTFVNDPDNFRINEQRRKIQMSAIFDWYEADFLEWLPPDYGTKQPHILDYIKIYYRGNFDDILYTYEIEYFDYDWGLNDVP